MSITGIPTGGPPPKDKYQLLKEEYYRADFELRRKTGELVKASHHINHLQRESQRSKDFISDLQNFINVHQKLGATKDTSARGSAAQALPGHHSEDSPGQQDRTLESTQSTPQDPGPPPPKDKYQLLKEEYYRTDLELRRKTGELVKASHHINHLQHESQRSRVFIGDLQNFINVHQKLGATEDTSGRENAAHHPSARSPQDAQALPGHHSEDEQQDPTSDSEIKQSTPQVPGPPPSNDKYQLLKEEYHRTRDELRQAHVIIENYDRELRKRTGELHKGGHHPTGPNDLQPGSSKDSITDLQNELINVHQQLEDAKALSEVRGKELLDTRVFLDKVDTLSISISEVGEKVTALNEENFQAAATLGEALIYKRYELSQKDLDKAAAGSQKMAGEKMTKLLITTQSQKPEPEVNPLLVQAVLQIFMVKFCVSKIQSWYPGDSIIGGFLSAIYSEIRSTGKHRIDSKTKFCLTHNNF